MFEFQFQRCEQSVMNVIEASLEVISNKSSSRPESGRIYVDDKDC